jgi:hypothetical protein
LPVDYLCPSAYRIPRQEPHSRPEPSAVPHACRGRPEPPTPCRYRPFPLSAPTGQFTIHWPQFMQLPPKYFFPKVPGFIMVSKPLLVGPMADTVCTFWHTLSHLLHSMHLLASLTMEGDFWSIWYFVSNSLIAYILNIKFFGQFLQFTAAISSYRYYIPFDGLTVSAQGLFFLHPSHIFCIGITTMPSDTGRTHAA